MRIDSEPPALSNDTSPTFAFSANEDDVDFECRLDDGEWEPCASPKTYAGVADGPRTFAVRGTDAAGNVSEVAVSEPFAIDTVNPVTTITAGPTDGAAVEPGSVSFEFSADKDGSRFECKLDSGPFLPCSSPRVYEALASGSHTFAVRAIDALGNIGNPVQVSFEVLRCTSSEHARAEKQAADAKRKWKQAKRRVAKLKRKGASAKRVRKAIRQRKRAHRGYKQAQGKVRHCTVA